MKKDDKKFLNSLIEGYHVEKEHVKTVKGDKVTTARIALDHLEEDSHYYDKLARCVEKKPHTKKKLKNVS